MSDDFILAQKREGYNDTIHLYREKDDPSESTVAFCNQRREINPLRDGFEIESANINKEYIIRDGEVVGKVCVNCRKAFTGENAQHINGESE